MAGACFALAEIPAEDLRAAAGLFFAWLDAGVGFGAPFVGAVASLTAPAHALRVAAGAVAAAIPAVVATGFPPWC